MQLRIQLKVIVAVLLVPLACSFLMIMGVLTQVEAKDFQLNIVREYHVDNLDFVRIKETHTVINNSPNQLISSTNTERFPVIVIDNKKDTIQAAINSTQAYQNGQLRQFNQIVADGYTQIEIPYGGNIGVGSSTVFSVEYSNYGMIEKKGALTDIYAPGFAPDFKFGSENTEINYVTKVFLADSLPAINFVAPAQNSIEKLDGNTIYTIAQEDLVGQNIWFQLGQEQFYKFTIKQEVQSSEEQNKGNYNEYKLVLPRDMTEARIGQNIFYKEISPEPYQVVLDKDGNLVATFRIPSHLSETISIEGYAELNTNHKKVTNKNSGEISDLQSFPGLDDYTDGAEFWEVSNVDIQMKAKELQGTEQNVNKLIQKTYEYIVDTIDYSQVKRFGINERQGALKTLQGGAAVCMEYSDLFLTLMRAQGIPARAAFGYGYDSILPDDKQEAHQWVQVYVPGLKDWISIDVTWGESGNSLIGGDLNHFYTHVASVEPEVPASVERKSFGAPRPLLPPEFSIQVLESIPGKNLLTSQVDLLNKYPAVSKTKVEDIKERISLLTSDQSLMEIFTNLNLVVIPIYVIFLILIPIILFRFVRMILKSIKRHDEKAERVLEIIQNNQPLPPINPVSNDPIIENSNIPPLPTKKEFENEE